MIQLPCTKTSFSRSQPQASQSLNSARQVSTAASIAGVPQRGAQARRLIGGGRGRFDRRRQRLAQGHDAALQLRQQLLGLGFGRQRRRRRGVSALLKSSAGSVRNEIETLARKLYLAV